MPTTISQLFKQTGLNFSGQVGWGQPIKSKANGFYVVAITDSKDKLVCWDRPDFCDKSIKQWIDLVKSGGNQIKVDKNIADLNSIKIRFENFWLPDETIVYIGKAGPTKKRTISKRVKEYYRTPFGCKSKHAGGQWINALLNISSLNVFYSEYYGNDLEAKEEQLISYYMENVSDKSKENLFDKINCFPFANKELYIKSRRTKIRKDHGLSNQTIDCGIFAHKNRQVY